jgi:LysR family transcriptional regulator for metE and metH
MHLELKHLRLVQAITETGTVTGAAKALSLTQSALSHQLREIEARLGTRLFLRVRGRMVLAPSGELLLGLAARVLGPVEEVEASVSRARKEGAYGVLRLSTECYTCYHWLPGIFAPFQRRWPGVELRIVAEATRRPMEALQAGELDVAIVSTPFNAPRVRGVPLFDDELVLVLPPGHRLARRRYARAGDFTGETLILYNMPDEASTVLTEFIQPGGVRLKQLIRVQLTEAIVELTRAGIGIAVLARWAVAPQLLAGSLVQVPLGRRGLPRSWVAAIRTDLPSPPYLNAFLAALRTGLANGPIPSDLSALLPRSA